MGDLFSQCLGALCGGGHLAKVLIDAGHDVLCSDIVDRGFEGTIISDFLLNPSNIKNRDIITNPPYKYAEEFVRHALEISTDGVKIAMFLRIQFLEGKSRLKLFSEYPPKKVYVFSERVLCAKNAQFQEMIDAGGSAIAFAWFIWEKGFNGITTLQWIDKGTQAERTNKKKLW